MLVLGLISFKFFSPEQPPAPVLMLLMMILRTGRREEAVLAILPGGTIMIAVTVRTLLGVLVEVEARGASDLGELPRPPGREEKGEGAVGLVGDIVREGACLGDTIACTGTAAE